MACSFLDSIAQPIIRLMLSCVGYVTIHHILSTVKASHHTLRMPDCKLISGHVV